VSLANGGLYTAKSLLTSTDGVNWTWRNLVNRSWQDCAYGNGLWVAIGTTAFAYSADGISWTQIAVPHGGPYYRVGYRGGLFVAAGTDHVAYTSNGIDWTVLDVPNTWYGINSR
jgi:hypothetical protein